MTELTLVVPGLLGPWAESNLPGFPMPVAPSLGRFLAGSERCPGELDFYRAVAALHGIETKADVDPPIAPLCRLADGGGEDGNWWLRLDPVHLDIERGGVRLANPQALEITEAESRELWRVLEPYFEDIRWRVEPLDPTRWYLYFDSDPGLQTISLDSAVGASLEDLLPSGRIAAPWVARLTEIQMLLHDTSVNRDRERLGKPTINTLWPWGGGKLPHEVRAAATAVFSADVVLAGLAAMAGERYSAEVPYDFASLRELSSGDSKVLVTLDEVAGALADSDPGRWSEIVAEFDRRWLAPAFKGLRSGKLRRLNLWPCAGWVYRMSLRQAWFAAFRRGSLWQHL